MCKLRNYKLKSWTTRLTKNNTATLYTFLQKCEYLLNKDLNDGTKKLLLLIKMIVLDNNGRTNTARFRSNQVDKLVINACSLHTAVRDEDVMDNILTFNLGEDSLWLNEIMGIIAIVANNHPDGYVKKYMNRIVLNYDLKMRRCCIWTRN